MAKLHEEIIVVKVSRLIRDAEQPQPILGTDTMVSLEAVIQELAGPGVLVEIAAA